MSEDLILAIQNNLPFPDDDFATLPADLIPAGPNMRLASFRKLEAALGHAGASDALRASDLFQADPATHRYSVLLAELPRDGSAAEHRPLPGVWWRRETSTVQRYAIVAAVDRSLPARRQMERVLGRPAPSAIQVPADLGENAVAVCILDGAIKVTGGARYGFDFHWLRKVPNGTLSGDYGLALDALSTATLDIGLGGAFLGIAAVEPEGRLRLRLFRRNTSGLDAGAQVTVNAQADVPLPEKPEELVRAMLGVHEFQWLNSLAAATHRTDALAQKIAVPAQKLALFLEKWRQLDPQAAAALWRSAGGPLAEEGLADVLQALRQYSGREFSLERIEQALRDLASFQALDGWAQQRLLEAFGAIQNRDDLRRASAALGKAAEAARAAYKKALTAVEKKYMAEVAWHSQRFSQDTALLDCSFDFTPEGLAAYRRALAGDFTALLAGDTAHARLLRGALTQGLSGESRIELFLPVLDRKQWRSRWESLARAEIECGEDGRLFVYTADARDHLEKRNVSQSTLALTAALASRGAPGRFTLAYSDHRKLEPKHAAYSLAPVLVAYGFDSAPLEWLKAAATGDQIEASLALTIPGELVTCWLRTPDEKAPEFFPVFSSVSVAVQRAMRLWVPFVYFCDPRHYDDLGAAWPLVFYQSLRPSPGRPRCDFTYDLMEPHSLELNRPASVRGLANQLRLAHQELLAAGRTSTARFYDPMDAETILAAIRKMPYQLNALLTADAFFVDRLVKLGLRGRELNEALARDPAQAVRHLARFAADLTAAFHRKLRHLYGGEGFVAFGALLMVEATRALGAALNREAGLSGVLRLTARRPGQAQVLETTFVNAAYRP